MELHLLTGTLAPGSVKEVGECSLPLPVIEAVVEYPFLSRGHRLLGSGGGEPIYEGLEGAPVEASLFEQLLYPSLLT